MNIKSYIPFYRRNLSLAIPVMITQAGQIIVQFADNIMVGQLGTDQFAGVGFANALMKSLAALCPESFTEPAEQMSARFSKAEKRKSEAAAHERNKRNGKRRTNA